MAPPTRFTEPCREEFLKLPEAGMVRGADEHRSAESEGHRADAAKDERAKDPVTQLGFHDEEVPKSLWPEQERFHPAGRPSLHERPRAGELPHLGEKYPLRRSTMGMLRPSSSRQLMTTVPETITNISTARLPTSQEQLFVVEGAALAETGQAIDLGVAQGPEHLATAAVEPGKIRHVGE